MKKFILWIRENYLALVAPILILAIWEAAGQLGLIRATLLPKPSAIAVVLVEVLSSGELLSNLGVSILRVAQGFIIGAGLGILVGVQVALSRKLQTAVSLIFGVLRPIPVIAWIPVLILWMGIDEGSKITVIAIGSFWTVLVSVIEGIKNVDKKFLEVATILEKDHITLLTKVILPAALPAIFTGVRVGIDVAWRSVVAAELIAAASGIGYMIMYARELSQIDVVLVGVLSIGFTGIIIEQLLQLLEKRLLRWNVNIH
ncbi:MULTISPECIES: ABC transporter permease [Sporomusa]|jgi:sulfonate transport system permease protein|uniref:Aliphatic sulfonates transport permease protein SsuC n=1 Tax=Sporomusa sphaeroides DSM 2875 TaxID=1337886 RepID=A0ABP2CAU7_9FIRM|nr:MULTISPECIES: ABC transporter permease [Sporomusa]MCM0760747.1 ABC transporter permease [Sporomusa sphaeroides DSM 2875]OLS55148.1 putative aliphatic sulfonates transport permease protein SsuC [Sporomusa sphaeroides DSM 2875]CVK20514.1 Putative aliphatic sulfonates transport permease protein SsuC [Sporomusa sphaeroides DSM 2875]HML32276.1 ABC transporter permease [Sporomusa sphaeroides]